MKKDKKYLIAVYGSLKKGHFNNDWLRGCNYLGDIKTKPDYTLLDFGPYPAIVANGETAIHCEIYEVAEYTFVDLSRMEYAAGYDLTQIETEYGAAVLYVFDDNTYDTSSSPVVESGNWVIQKKFKTI